MSSSQLAPLDVLVIGGGMITQDQILPSLYHLQRLGAVGEITICALGSGPLRTLAESAALAEAFPGQSFRAMPPLDRPADEAYPDLYREALAAMRPYNLAVVAVPDHLHNAVIREALARDQHVLAVKPLVLRYQEAVEIERIARARGLFVGVEYHKRFDRRSLEARRQYRAGRLGEFRCGEARLIEPYYYRHSNFQNWFTKENSDPFTYIGCHYVDLVYFITGLRPVEVSVRGVEGKFPNGNVGYLWSIGRVVWENGAVLSVVNGLGYPDAGAGSNDQGLCLYCEGDDCGGILHHDDQYRGVSHGYVEPASGVRFRYVSPDYFRLVPWQGDGLRPVGYGYDSIEALVEAAASVNAAPAAEAPAAGRVRACTHHVHDTQDKPTGRPADTPSRSPLDDGACEHAPYQSGPTNGQQSPADDPDALARRQAVLAEIDRRDILATPANSAINEQVTEAARRSIAEDGRAVAIDYAASGSREL